MRPWLVGLCFCGAIPVFGAELENRLRSQWQGSWVILRSDVASNCDDRYTNVQVNGGNTTLKGSHHFGAGELGRVHKLNQHRSRVDLHVDLVEPLRTSELRGPFELYDQVACQIELEIAVPRNLVKSKSIDAINALVAQIAEAHTSREGAASSINHNGRIVEPYPDDYERTLAEYRTWLDETLGRPLRDRLAEAVEEDAEIVDDVRRDPEYGGGLALGMADFDRSLAYKDCDDLTDETFYPGSGKAPSELSGSDETNWRDGYRDGQVLAFNVELARAITECLLEIAAE